MLLNVHILLYNTKHKVIKGNHRPTAKEVKKMLIEFNAAQLEILSKNLEKNRRDLCRTGGDDKTIQDIGEMLLKVRQALKQIDTKVAS